MLTKPLRSVLCAPASNARALAKFPELDCDAAIIDLEDAVHPDRRHEARETMRTAARAWTKRPKRLAVRINPLQSQWGTEDLIVALALRPQAVVLPKAEMPQDVIALSEAFNEFDLPERPEIWAMIETASGVLNVAAIAELGRHKSARLAAFIVGPNDLARETGVRGAEHVAPWMMHILLAARAGSLGVIDGVFNDFRDADGFAASCALGRARGFDGKMLIHPAQIAHANRIFSPDEAEIAQARAIIAAFALPENAGKGVINLDGQMVERLHLEQAQAILAQAEHS